MCADISTSESTVCVTFGLACMQGILLKGFAAVHTSTLRTASTAAVQWIDLNRSPRLPTQPDHRDSRTSITMTTSNSNAAVNTTHGNTRFGSATSSEGAGSSSDGHLNVMVVSAESAVRRQMTWPAPVLVQNNGEDTVQVRKSHYGKVWAMLLPYKHVTGAQLLTVADGLQS